MGIKVEIPEFDGTAHPDDFIDWLSTVERVFDLREIPDHLKVKLVAIKLHKYASLWWDHVKKQRMQEGKSKVQMWVKMKKLLQTKFLPINHRQEAFLEFHVIAQLDLSVQEFITKFDQMRMRCAMDEEEEHTIARFLGGLRTEISEVVQLQQYWTYTDVCKLALRVEKQLKGRERATTSKHFSSSRPSTIQNPKLIAPRVADTNSGKTTPSITSAPSMQRVIRCFKCQGIGHLARDCPNKQLAT